LTNFISPVPLLAKGGNNTYIVKFTYDISQNDNVFSFP